MTLSTANGRDIPLRLLTPEGCNKCALMIFSPGANSTYDRYNELLLPLAQAESRIAIPNHTDSEDRPNRGAYKPQDWMPTRLEDYITTASTYETDYLIAAGHSFGGRICELDWETHFLCKLVAKIAQNFTPQIEMRALSFRI